MSSIKKRGFGSMDPEKHRLIASKGGKVAHERGKAHEFTSEEARIAGSKGGRSKRRTTETRIQETQEQELVEGA